MKSIDSLTALPMDEYNRIWGSFGSGFWEYKKSVFGAKQTEFCYAGLWSAYIDMANGEATSCYGSWHLGNVFENPDSPFPVRPVGKCLLAHCYNAHAFLTVGCIPGANDVYYGDIRNRTRKDGGQWLQPGLLSFFNTKLEESNELLTPSQLVIVVAFCVKYDIMRKIFLRLIHSEYDGVIDPVLTDRYNFKLDVFGNVPVSDGVIVMLGGSLTENTPFNEYIGFRHCVMNR